jgi:uncharacterized protein YqgV (UPF0045/DUF77 family)
VVAVPAANEQVQAFVAAVLEVLEEEAGVRMGLEPLLVLLEPEVAVVEQMHPPAHRQTRFLAATADQVFYIFDTQYLMDRQR